MKKILSLMAVLMILSSPLHAAASGNESPPNVISCTEPVSRSVAGNMVMLSDYTSLTALIADAGSKQTMVCIDTKATLAENTVIPRSMRIIMQWGGLIASASTCALVIMGKFEAPPIQVFSGFAPGEVAGLSESCPEWFGATGDGATNDHVALQSALSALSAGGRMLIAGRHLILGELKEDTDHITVEFGPGASITLGAAGRDGLNLSGDYVSLLRPHLMGYGTFVTSGSSGAALIRLTGNHAKVEDAYLKDAEQVGLRCDGDYPTLSNITIEGGPTFTGALDIGTYRQNYGLWLHGVKGLTLKGLRVIPNAAKGTPIEGIVTSSGVNGLTDSTLTDIHIEDCWDHGLYMNLDGCSIRNGVVFGCGVKLNMQPRVTAGKGITVSDIIIDVGRRRGPLRGDTGLCLESICWSNFNNITIRNASDAGVLLQGNKEADKVSHNTFSNFVIEGVEDGNGSSAFGVHVTQTEEFSYNTFSGFVIKGIGSDTDGKRAFIHIGPVDNGNHVGNLFSGFTCDGSQMLGISLRHLTDSKFHDIYMKNIGLGLASYGMFNVDCTRCDIDLMTIDGGIGTMIDAYAETSSSSNAISRLTSLNAAKEKFFGNDTRGKLLSKQWMAADMGWARVVKRPPGSYPIDTLP